MIAPRITCVGTMVGSCCALKAAACRGAPGKLGRRVPQPRASAARARNLPCRALIEDRELSMTDADARLEKLRARFDAADASGTGKLDRSALRSLLECTDTFCLTKHWLPDDVLDTVMAKYDKDENGVLDFDEFLDLAQDKVLLEGKLEEFDTAFKKVAGDGGDEITSEQLKSLFEGIGDPKSDAELKSIMGRYDTDSNGKIDFAEFLEMARTHTVELNSVIDYVALGGSPKKSKEGFHWPWDGSGAADAPPKKRERPADTPLVTEVESSEDFVRIITEEAPGLVVLEVAFTWCRPCKGFERKYQRFAEFYKAVRFCKVYGNLNEDTKDMVKNKLGVKASPAFYAFRMTEGKADPLEPVASWTGANEDKFRNNINGAIEGVCACARVDLPPECTPPFSSLCCGKPGDENKRRAKPANEPLALKCNQTNENQTPNTKLQIGNNRSIFRGLDFSNLLAHSE